MQLVFDGSSFTMEYVIVQRDTGEIMADGSGVLVWVDYSVGRSIPLPAELKAEIERFEGI